MIKVTYKIFLVFILTGFNVSSNTIKGTELQRIVENWLQKNDQTANIKILGKLKYPYCGESKLLINDIIKFSRSLWPDSVRIDSG